MTPTTQETELDAPWPPAASRATPTAPPAFSNGYAAVIVALFHSPHFLTWLRGAHDRHQPTVEKTSGARSGLRPGRARGESGAAGCANIAGASAPGDACLICGLWRLFLAYSQTAENPNNWRPLAWAHWALFQKHWQRSLGITDPSDIAGLCESPLTTPSQFLRQLLLQVRSNCTPSERPDFERIFDTQGGPYLFCTGGKACADALSESSSVAGLPVSLEPTGTPAGLSLLSAYTRALEAGASLPLPRKCPQCGSARTRSLGYHKLPAQLIFWVDNRHYPSTLEAEPALGVDRTPLDFGARFDFPLGDLTPGADGRRPPSGYRLSAVVYYEPEKKGHAAVVQNRGQQWVRVSSLSALDSWPTFESFLASGYGEAARSGASLLIFNRASAPPGPPEPAGGGALTVRFATGQGGQTLRLSARGPAYNLTPLRQHRAQSPAQGPSSIAE